jgi:hypothetical protein
MDGDISELVEDVFAPYQAGPVQVDPTGPSSGEAHVVRGGWLGLTGTRVTYRGDSMTPDERRFSTGFRIVRDSTP